MNTEELKSQAKEEIKGFIEEDSMTFVEGILDKYITKASKSTRERDIEVVEKLQQQDKSWIPTDGYNNGKSSAYNDIISALNNLQ